MTDQQTEHVTYADDKAINPNHYQGRGGKQCYDVIREILGVDQLMAFYKANTIKYLYRFDTKNGLQDIRKAKWYAAEYKRLRDNHAPIEVIVGGEEIKDTTLDTILTSFTDDKIACYAIKAIIFKAMYTADYHAEFIVACIDKLEELWSSVAQPQKQ